MKSDTLISNMDTKICGAPRLNNCNNCAIIVIWKRLIFSSNLVTSNNNNSNNNNLYIFYLYTDIENLFICHTISIGRDSFFGIATQNGLAGTGIESRSVPSLLYFGYRVSFRGWSRRGVALTTHSASSLGLHGHFWVEHYLLVFLYGIDLSISNHIPVVKSTAHFPMPFSC